MAAEKMTKVKRWFVAAVVACVIVVVFQNTETVRTQVLFIAVEMPRVVLLSLMLLIGFLVGLLVRRDRKASEGSGT